MLPARVSACNPYFSQCFCGSSSQVSLSLAHVLIDKYQISYVYSSHQTYTGNIYNLIIMNHESKCSTPECVG